MSPDRVEDGIRILRPLLDVRRATTRAACTAAGLPPWEDPHNLDRRFLRVRVRQDVMPVLEAELGPASPRRSPARAISCVRMPPPSPR
jgi:tRNA(Ile)-lysidine synthase